jgi:hypothetical protein
MGDAYDGRKQREAMESIETAVNKALSLGENAVTSAAPTDAAYVTLTTNTTLTAERTLAVGAALSLTDGGANNPVTIGTAAFTGDVTASANSHAMTIANDAVTFAKMLNSTAASVLVGRGSASGAGDFQEITLGSGISMAGTVLSASGTGAPVGASYVCIATDATLTSERTLAVSAALSLSDGGANNPVTLGRAALTGDVTASADSNATTIANNAVTYAKMQDVSAASRLIGRGASSGSGDPEEMTVGSSLSISGTVLSLNVDNQNAWTKSQRTVPYSLTDGANISVDASQSNVFKVTLAGNRTLDNPTNLSDGMVLTFRIKQDGTGSRTLAYGSKYEFPGDVAPTLTTTANKMDVITCLYDGDADKLYCTISQNFSTS